ncbi:hypothetical protein [Ruminococcus albus]|nr:hypothetical protein [Ruminococcus albus]MCC3351141.1 hypothetical protein [Ruminococcus albus 8]
MSKNKPKYKKINNSYFKNFCSIFNTLLSIDTDNVLSNMQEASLDDNNKKKQFYLYDGKLLNMDAVKLDDMTEPFLQYMKKERSLNYFEQPHAVDAMCVDRDNEWFFIEFKNCPIYKVTSEGQKYNSEVLSSIRQKMFGSLWLLFTLDSFAHKGLFGDDITEYARKHFTYIVVVSRDKNPDEFRRIHECIGNRYTPLYFSKYVGYYFKDVYLLTEKEFASFIKNFKN